jgi:hypothetical protein
MSFAGASAKGRYGWSVVERRCEWVGESNSVVSIGDNAGLDLLFRKEDITVCAEEDEL